MIYAHFAPQYDDDIEKLMLDPDPSLGYPDRQDDAIQAALLINSVQGPETKAR